MNKIYATDLGISGSAEFASITTSMLNVTGNAEITGTTTLGNVDVSKTLSLTRADGTIPLSIGSSNSTYMSISSTGIQTKRYTNHSPLYLNQTGGVVYLSTGEDIKAEDGTLTATKLVGTSAIINDLMVTNELRSFKWNIQHIANLGGTFLVTPTLKCTEGSATISITSVTGTGGYNIVCSISDSSAITGNSLGGATWSSASKIKISGSIGGVVIGTCDGVLTANMNNTSGTLALKFNYPGQSVNPLSVKNYAASEIEDLTVMLTTVGATNPIGIYMTAYDANRYSHISLYGGTDEKPVVRIGNLGGNDLDAVGGITPSGWGIYTQNGFFHGTLAAIAGKIGKFSISDALYTTAKAFGTTDNNVYIGDDGISLGKTFKVTKAGALTSTSGTIGGWTIGTSAIYKTTNSMTSTGVGLYLGTDGIRNYKDANTFVNVTDGKITAKAVDLTGAIYATSGTIGSDATSGNRWQIGAKSIYNTTSSMTSTGVGTYVGVDGIRNYKDANTYVNIQNGVITAKAVNLTGSITATSGTIGGCTIDTNGVLQVPAANITGQLTASQIDASGITIGQSQVTNLSTALGNKADATTVTTLSNKVTAVYGTSSTAAATQIKDITCANFTLFTGARITIKFTNANTAASPKIKFNGQDDANACAVWVNNAGATTSNPILWTANTVLTFTYDGSVWVLENKPSTYNVNSNTAATAQSKTTTTPNGVLVLDGTIAVVSFSQSNTYASNYLQLNFAGTGNAKIYLDSGVTSATNTLLWNANTILTFTRDGGLWRLTNRSDAAKTATSYITYINATDGIKVHNASDTANYAQLNSDGMFVYKDGTQVAKFGDEVLIGKTGYTNINITKNNLSVNGPSRYSYAIFEAGIKDDTNGETEVVEKYYARANSTYTGIFLDKSYTEVINVAVGGSSIPYTLIDDRNISVSDAYLDKLISIRYKTTNVIPYFSFGENNSCTTQEASAFGYGNSVHGSRAMAIGEDNTVSMVASVAIGNENQVHSPYSMAVGTSCRTTGYGNQFVLGYELISASDQQFIIGRYNAIDRDYTFPFIIGNGEDSSSRSNAFAITWDGTPRGQKVQHNKGSAFTLSAGVIPGFVTNNTVVLTLTTERFLDTVSTITVSTLKGGLRGVQGFLDGSTYNTDWKGSAYTVSASILSRRHIEIRIVKNSGNFTNLVTNSPVAFYVNPTLTLNFS